MQSTEAAGAHLALGVEGVERLGERVEELGDAVRQQVRQRVLERLRELGDVQRQRDLRQRKTVV
jgi:hypothetical protein